MTSWHVVSKFLSSWPLDRFDWGRHSQAMWRDEREAEILSLMFLSLSLISFVLSTSLEVALAV